MNDAPKIKRVNVFSMEDGRCVGIEDDSSVLLLSPAEARRVAVALLKAATHCDEVKRGKLESN